MSWKEFVKDFCHFTLRDRIAISTLLLLSVFVWVLPGVIFQKKHGIIKSDPEVISALAKPDSVRVKSSEPGIQSQIHSKQIHLFYFDPNKLDVNGWIQLGVREKTAVTIQKYISHGGKFRSKEDLQKIYGLSADDYERIEPYVRIETEKYFRKSDTINKPTFKKYTLSVPVIDINLSDTTAFIALPGIGSKLASRIVAFRDRLGEFFSAEQVSETFGLPDSTFQKIRKWLKVENAVLKKISINTATIEELKVHPYIRWNLAKLIIAYRTEHGPYKKIEDLKNIMAITEEVFEKMKYYLIVD